MTRLNVFVLFALIVGLFSSPSLGGSTDKREIRKKAKALHAQAMGFYKKKDYKNARKKWTEAASTDPHWWKPDYNMACVDSLENKLTTVTPHLEKAFELLMKDEIEVTEFVRFYRYIQKDSDFKNYRKTADYKTFLGKMKDYAPVFFNLSYSGVAMHEEDAPACSVPQGRQLAGAAFWVSFDDKGNYSKSIGAGPSYKGSYYFNKKDNLLSLSLTREVCYDACVKSPEDSRQKVTWFEADIICLDNTCFCNNTR